jgi:ubiquitin-conjugating enzyme E2 variant
MASGSGEKIVIPRNFVLLEELEKAEKGMSDMTVSYGLVQSDDTSLTDWQCTILGPLNSPVENRIISLTLSAGEKYPEEAPTVQFQTKLNFPFVVRPAPFITLASRWRCVCVHLVLHPASCRHALADRCAALFCLECEQDGTGKLVKNKLTQAALKNWSPTNRLENVLLSLKSEMAHPSHRKLPQPPDGTTYL